MFTGSKTNLFSRYSPDFLEIIQPMLDLDFGNFSINVVLLHFIFFDCELPLLVFENVYEFNTR